MRGAGADDDPVFVTIGMLDNSCTRDLTRIGVGDIRFADNGETIGSDSATGVSAGRIRPEDPGQLGTVVPQERSGHHLGSNAAPPRR